MKTFIYGEWRGLPARQEIRTGERSFLSDGSWQRLGLGYDTEFRPFPDQIDNDAWAQKHSK